MTKLEGPLKRELAVRGAPYVLTIAPDGLKLAPKGRRRGYELAWEAFIDGEAALATALNASLRNGPRAVVDGAQAAAKRAPRRR